MLGLCGAELRALMATVEKELEMMREEFDGGEAECDGNGSERAGAAGATGYNE